MACLTVSPEDEKRVKGLGFLSNKGTDNFSARIITVNGKITAAQQRHIAEAAEKFGNGIVTFTTRLTVEVQGVPYDKIDEFRAFLAEGGLQTGGTGSKVRPVVSCKGTTCQYGLIDAYALSEEIHNRFYEGYSDVKLPHKFKIAVGGCPNNCVKPNLNDVGIIGQCIPVFDEDSCNGCKKCSVVTACPVNACSVVDGILEIDKEACINCGRCVGKCRFDAIEEGIHGYKIYIGGRWGKKIAQGKALHKVFTDKEEALKVIEKAILLFREQGETGERFARTIERLGFENVEEQLLSDGLLERKEEILKAQLHLSGGATC
ncbi:4Fe-4S binding protein [Lacrimispora sp. NSJ-141]|uniref:4Fe-4S binding protein n=1 Tax=Lientehia hominis TaxID=2897778 RepID=A0AAP2W933_9FIRM|nr:4Fe-4S binding protein [Lientehia hominis]MCD2492895.1 4Fe-4S binding protein [Lientehia hominis]